MKCVWHFCSFHWSDSWTILLFDLSDNPLLSSKVTVTIKVLDVNEFPPELAFVYETFVCENAKVGQVSVSVCVCARICMCVNNYLCFNLSFWACCWCCSELMWENCALIFSFHAYQCLPLQSFIPESEVPLLICRNVQNKWHNKAFSEFTKDSQPINTNPWRRIYAIIMGKRLIKLHAIAQY